VYRQIFGTRTFDVNKDGAAQYDLFADWTTDLIQQAGGDGPLLRQPTTVNTQRMDVPALAVALRNHGPGDRLR
jgi:hypothetical protein